jgi:hypothetical protein
VKASDADYDSEWATLDTDGVVEGTTNLYNRVPASGAARQILVKQSVTDYDSDWESEIPDQLLPVAGDLLIPNFPGGASTLTPDLDRVHAVPFWIPERMSFSHIGIRVTVAASAGGIMRLGIYTNVNSRPSALIVDAGTVSTTTTGIKEIAIAQTFDKGFVWLCMVQQVATCQINVYPTGVNGAAGVFRIPDSDAANQFANKRAGVFMNSISGALPSTFTISGLLSAILASLPYFYLRRA